MKIHTKLKWHVSNATFSSLALFGLVPSTGICNPYVSNAVFKTCSSDFNAIIWELINQAEIGDANGSLFLLQNVAAILEGSNDILRDGCGFLQNLVNTINTKFGTSITLSEVIHLARETVYKFPISDDEIEDYLLGLNLIDRHKYDEFYCDPIDFVEFTSHHKKSTKFWVWLSVATVTAGAVAICVINPGASPAIGSGLLELYHTRPET